LGLGLILAGAVGGLAAGGCSSGGGSSPGTGGAGGSEPRTDARSGTGATGGGASAGAGGSGGAGATGGTTSGATGGAGGSGGGGTSGGTGGQATPASDASGTADASVPADAGATPDTAAPDTGPATLPPFPLAQVRAARKERLHAVGAQIEGPTWRDGDLYFAQDGGGGGMMKLNAGGQVSRYRPELHPIGSFLLADGSTLWCDHEHLLLQMFPDGRAGILASGLAPKCNDVTVDAEGNIFFSDYTDSVYRVTPSGQYARALGGLAKPNGVEVDPDSRYLYIITGGRLLRSELSAGGMLGPAQPVVTLGGGNGDGAAFDQWGNLWVAVFQSGAAVIVDTTKKAVLGNLDFGGAGPTNLTFGGPQRDQLYVTIANSGIWRAHVGVPGFKGHPGAPSYPIKRMLPAP
jgi:sugar lactone lactonase YvrE